MAASCRLHWPNNVFGTLLLLLLATVVVVAVVVATVAAAVALKMPTRCNAAIKAARCWPLLVHCTRLAQDATKNKPTKKKNGEKRKEIVTALQLELLLAAMTLASWPRAVHGLSPSRLLAQTRSVRNDFRFYDATCIRDEALLDSSWTVHRNAAPARSSFPL